MHRVLSLALVLTLPGCAPELEPGETVADVRHFMITVVEPAAEVYWASVGTIMTLERTVEIAPKTHEDWEAVRDAAMILAESGNLLLLPERVQEGEQWTILAQALTATGRRALAAAEARDPEAVFDAGGEVYLVCAECHAAFAPDALRSSFGQED